MKKNTITWIISFDRTNPDKRRSEFFLYFLDKHIFLYTENYVRVFGYNKLRLHLSLQAR